LSKGLFLQPLGNQAGRLSFRGELGTVVSQNSDELPSTQLFLAGGDHSVRGYAPGSIGIEQANGLVLAGRYLATGSLEWQRPITVNHQRSEWESAVFVDAGTVSNTTQQLKTRVGVGVGARWRSQVGPVRIDLAYGQAVRKLRLHMNVGFTF
jgi:translocation and assembly module TamA